MPMKNDKMRLLYWYLTALCAVVLDAITKYFAVRFLEPQGSVALIPGVLHLTYVTNTGAAFSILQGHRWVFLLVTAVTIVLLTYLLYRFRRMHALFCISLAMILGGGIGNMIDRVWKGYVVDFVDFRLINFAVFNVADIFVSVGCAVLFVYVLFFDRKQNIRLFGDPPDVDDKKNDA